MRTFNSIYEWEDELYVSYNYTFTEEGRTVNGSSQFKVSIPEAIVLLSKIGSERDAYLDHLEDA